MKRKITVLALVLTCLSATAHAAPTPSAGIGALMSLLEQLGKWRPATPGNGT